MEGFLELVSKQLSNSTCDLSQVIEYYNSSSELINIHYGNDFLLRRACEKGKTKLVEWLLQVDPEFNIHYNNEEMFRWACFYGHYDVLQVLINHDNMINGTTPNIHCLNDAAMTWACIHGYFNIVGFLLKLDSLDNYDFDYDNCYILRQCCLNGKIRMCKWILLNFPHQGRVIINNSFIRKDLEKNNSIEMLQWLRSIDIKSQRLNSNNKVENFIESIKNDIKNKDPIRYCYLIDYIISLNLDYVVGLSMHRNKYREGILDYLKGIIYYYELFSTDTIEEKYEKIYNPKDNSKNNNNNPKKNKKKDMFVAGYFVSNCNIDLAKESFEIALKKDIYIAKHILDKIPSSINFI